MMSRRDRPLPLRATLTFDLFGVGSFDAVSLLASGVPPLMAPALGKERIGTDRERKGVEKMR